MGRTLEAGILRKDGAKNKQGLWNHEKRKKSLRGQVKNCIISRFRAGVCDNLKNTPIDSYLKA